MANKRAPRRLVATTNYEASRQIRLALVELDLSAQEAIILALIDFLKLDLTLEQATNFKLEGEEEDGD